MTRPYLQRDSKYHKLLTDCLPTVIQEEVLQYNPITTFRAERVFTEDCDWWNGDESSYWLGDNHRVGIAFTLEYCEVFAITGFLIRNARNGGSSDR